MLYFILVFFFKQKTAYEMRISDWSSDVCSSDLCVVLGQGKSKYDAVVESLAIHFRPVTLTNLTSAVGFLSMNLAEAPPFRDLGNLVAKIGRTSCRERVCQHV